MEKRSNNGLWVLLIVVLILVVTGAYFFIKHHGVSIEPHRGSSITSDVTVSHRGDGNFRTISEAIQSAPSHSPTRFVIRVRSGVYNEAVVVPADKQNIVVIGEGADVTRVTGSRQMPDYSTSNSATFSVLGDGFMAQDITFENAAGNRNEAQAVALLCSANYTIFYRCKFIGYHDTLYAKEGKQFYRECDIYGTVDFIFGFALAVYQKCNLLARLPDYQVVTYIAQGRMSMDQQSAFTFQGCKFTTAPEVATASLSTMSGFLGRPWFPFSTVMIMESYLDRIIDPSGWVAWPDTPVTNAIIREYRNFGPGADTSRRVKWPGYKAVLDGSEAMPYTVSQLIEGDHWIPETGVPYSGGFLLS